MSGADDKSLLIYVVDDDQTIRELLMRQIQALGHRAMGFATGGEAIDAVSIAQPGLLLMDLHMPGHNGDEWCQKLKAQPTTAGTPIIILTAADSPHEVMRSWRAGADDFLPKPVRLRQLASKLEAVSRAAAVEPTVRAGGPRVMLADDSRFFASLLGASLENCGLQVLYARSGTEALELFEKNASEIDLVITDLVMPGADGLAVARAVRAKAGTSKPIWILSGSTTGRPANDDQILEVTGRPALDKRVLPIEVIVSRVTASLRLENAELRAAERVPFFSVVEFKPAESADWLSGFSYDVSTGGIFVRSMTPPSPGTELQLRVKFTFRTSAPSSTGKVVWSNAYRARRVFSYPVGMGIRFTVLSSEDTEAIARLVMGGRAGAVA